MRTAWAFAFFILAAILILGRLSSGFPRREQLSEQWR
jgi:hypothetical protein